MFWFSPCCAVCCIMLYSTAIYTIYNIRSNGHGHHYVMFTWLCMRSIIEPFAFFLKIKNLSPTTGSLYLFVGGHVCGLLHFVTTLYPGVVSIFFKYFSNFPSNLIRPLSWGKVKLLFCIPFIWSQYVHLWLDLSSFSFWEFELSYGLRLFLLCRK